MSVLLLADGHWLVFFGPDLFSEQPSQDSACFESQLAIGEAFVQRDDEAHGFEDVVAAARSLDVEAGLPARPGSGQPLLLHLDH